MKKFVMALVIAQTALLSVAQAAQKVAPISLQDVCKTLAQAELPGSCAVECEAPAKYGADYILKVTGENGKASLVSGENDFAERSIVNGNTLVIQFSQRGSESSLQAVVDRADRVQSLSVNGVECK